MTIPFERTRSLVQTKTFLQELQHKPRVPKWIRLEAQALLRHYPLLMELELAHKALPEWFGPVPPFSRMSGTADVQHVIGGTNDGDKK